MNKFESSLENKKSGNNEDYSVKNKEKFLKIEISIADKNKYENSLWEEANKLSESRRQIEEKINILYEQINKNNPADDLLALETDYWQAKNVLEKLEREENKIQDYLEKLADNSINENDLTFLKSLNKTDEKKLSKKKQKILEERQKFGEIINDPHALKEFSNEKMRITTGRRAKSIKNVDTGSAEREFIYRTADTHGGKGAIKKGDTYISESGKRIRKK